MSDSTVGASQPAEDSISADLASAFDDYEANNEPEAEADTGAEPEEGEAVEEAEAEDTGEEASEPEEDTGADPEELKAPDNWSAEDKERFNKLTGIEGGKEAQEFLLNRHKAMEGDYTRKTQELADFRKSWEPVHKMFEPYLQQIQANGQTPAHVIQNWAQIDRAMEANPQQTLQWLAQQYNVDLGGGEAKDDDVYVDPKVQSLEQQLQQLQGQITQREQHEIQQRVGSMQERISTFAEEKTEAGEPAHPHFDEVVEDMVAMARAERAAGRNPEIKDLYEKAVWANPSVREKLLSAQQAAADKKRQDEAKAKAKKAKSAAASVTGSPGDASPSDDLSLRDQLEKQFN